MQTVAERLQGHLNLIQRIGSEQEKTEARYYQEAIKQAASTWQKPPQAVNFAQAKPDAKEADHA